jgi:menaquinone-dependent protoporphyrinogen oxidase
MNVLVAYASRHGSTAGIAERIAATLRAEGLSAEAHPASQVGAIDGYDAYVVGSAAYMFRWLKDASRFVERHRALLEHRPVWLFSSGPLGADRVDAHGNDVLEASRPKDFEALGSRIQPRGTQVFFGAWDPQSAPVGLVEWLVRRMPAKDTLPAGDFRDWEAIDAWAREIAQQLRAAAPASAA